MTKKVRPERQLLIVSRRKTPDQAGLARLVAAMVMHQLQEQAAATASETSARTVAGNAPKDDRA